jgi:hypothetical protein
MRSFRLALALSIVGASACSLLLDTEALQKKGAAGAGGAGGSGGAGGGGADVDAGRDAGISCNSDLDCQPVDTVDGCLRYQCVDKTCLPPRAHTGLAVASVGGDPETADQAEEIGYPSLLADGTDLVLAFWKRNQTTTNIVIRKYDERPEIGPVSADLNAISTNRFESLSSSPGIIIRGIPKRIRLLAAAKPMGAMATGMYQMDVDLSTLRISAQQPMRTDLGVTGYDVNPRGPAPRLLPGGLAEPFGMWIQQGKLYYLDGNGAAEVYAAKRVIGFAPLAANAGIHAALETTELGNTDDQGQTELWTRNSNLLTSLVGDVPGSRRRGVAATATGEGAAPINFILWSFERAGSPSLLYAVSGCDGMQCTAVGAPTDSTGTLSAVAPGASSARVMGETTERDMGLIFQMTAPDATRPAVTNTAIIGGISRLTSMAADGGPGLSAAAAMNPSSFFVTLSNLPAANIGPTSVAMTSGGAMMVAWVERGPNQSQLKTRRFQVKSCP